MDTHRRPHHIDGRATVASAVTRRCSSEAKNGTCLVGPVISVQLFIGTQRKTDSPSNTVDGRPQASSAASELAHTPIEYNKLIRR